ncbi:hypothetical protein CASFOL_000891 [Castilleja foliolosa]|uniref:Uncharacterized protein n=1 Tax=Castilleja foliolosa TaxID=1961234 RepID=A0ABD3EPS8_9LAMI
MLPRMMGLQAVLRRLARREWREVASCEANHRRDQERLLYNLLCLEGIALVLRRQLYSGVSRFRPYVLCAVLRDVTFDEAQLNSFIDFQDQLNQTICGAFRKAIEI